MAEDEEGNKGLVPSTYLKVSFVVVFWVGVGRGRAQSM